MLSKQENAVRFSSARTKMIDSAIQSTLLTLRTRGFIALKVVIGLHHPAPAIGIWNRLLCRKDHGWLE